jgi:hypothetical protein
MRRRGKMEGPMDNPQVYAKIGKSGAEEKVITDIGLSTMISPFLVAEVKAGFPHLDRGRPCLISSRRPPPDLPSMVGGKHRLMPSPRFSASHGIHNFATGTTLRYGHGFARFAFPLFRSLGAVRIAPSTALNSRSSTRRSPCALLPCFDSRFRSTLLPAGESTDANVASPCDWSAPLCFFPLRAVSNRVSISSPVPRFRFLRSRFPTCSDDGPVRISSSSEPCSGSVFIGGILRAWRPFAKDNCRFFHSSGSRLRRYKFKFLAKNLP